MDNNAKYHLKLNQPKELPAEGVTSVAFKPWRNHLINFLQQDVDNYLYLPGGLYAEWTASAESPDGKRIAELKATDELKVEIDAGEGDAAAKQAKTNKLLLTRNSQLAKMIQHIVSFVHYTEQDDIDQNSVSVEWIFTYLRKHYNIEAKGANFLKITEHTFKQGMQPQVFYKQFRASFINNLRKRNDKIEHKGPGKVMQEDETLSPSFEDAIILWSLEKIDARLPKKVRKEYEHRLDNSTYLIDLHATIFQAIPSMLEDLDHSLGALAVKDVKDEVTLRAFNPTVHADGYRGGRGPAIRRGAGGRGARGGGAGSGRAWSERFCRVCKVAGKPERVFTSHNTGDCGFFSNRDRKDMYASLKAMNLDDEIDAGDDDETWTLEEGGDGDQEAF